MDYWKQANEIKEEIVAHRRYFHEHAETGLDTKLAADYVMQQLTAMGYQPKRIIENGVVATVGRPGGKVILLRADMDALPMQEESGEPFACTTGTAHTCGHDCHAAWLLGAAKLLKENESALNGMVKLMFQPGEEIFAGSRAMIEAGVLEDPKPDCAIACHVAPGRMPVGLYMYNTKNAMMYSNDSFKIVCRGVGSHGAYPDKGVSPINIAVHVYLALQEIIAREVAATVPAIMTVGKFNAGLANNAIPDEAVLEGSIRTPDPETRAYLTRRLTEVAEGTAKTFRGTAEVSFSSQVPPAICDKAFTEEILGYLAEVPVPGAMGIPDMQASASEDFALIMEQVPSALFYLSAGYPDRDVAPSHNPKVVFNEDVLPIGAAYMAHAATRWLENNA